MPLIPVTGEAEAGGSQSETGPREKYKTLSEKWIKAKRAGVVEHLPSKCIVWSSIPSTAKKKKKVIWNNL
jgi:hypothetical protein